MDRGILWWAIGRNNFTFPPNLGFPGGSDGKESACNAGDLGLIPGSGISPGEGISYPLQYSWASLVVQLVKNLPAMWETWVQSLGWELRSHMLCSVAKQKIQATKRNAIYIETSLVSQMVKNLPECKRSRFAPWVRKIPWRRE